MYIYSLERPFESAFQYSIFDALCNMLFFLATVLFTAFSWEQDHPVVITKFIRGAREVEVDAVARMGKVRDARIIFQQKKGKITIAGTKWKSERRIWDTRFWFKLSQSEDLCCSGLIVKWI